MYSLKIKRTVHLVPTLAAASARLRAVRDASGQGASRFGCSFDVISIETGKAIARISYNGRVWPPGPYVSGQKELTDADLLDGGKSRANDLAVNVFDADTGNSISYCVRLSEVMGDDLDAFETAKRDLERDHRCYVGGGAAPLVLITLA